MDIELTALDKILAAYRNNERDFVTYQELAALLRSAAVKVSANPAENEQLARDAQAIVDSDVAALGQARRAKKIGGSYQAEGTIVSTFATLAGETRHVFEFDQPAGMLHIFGPGQVEIAAAAAPRLVADERAEVRAFEAFAREACQMPDGIEVNWGALWTQQAYEGWKARAALVAAPVQAQEPIAEIHCQEFHELAMDYRGASFSKAPMAYKSLCEYIKRLVAPVQPVAVPDGCKSELSAYQYWASKQEGGFAPIDAWLGRAALSAPAAQVDAKFLLPESVEEDGALWRVGINAFRLALNEMTGSDGYVVKKTYEAMRAAIAAKAAS